MDNTLTKEMYDKYLKANNVRLDEINRELAFKPTAEWVKRLSFEQWIQWQNGELKVYDPLNFEDRCPVKLNKIYHLDLGASHPIEVRPTEFINDKEVKCDMLGSYPGKTDILDIDMFKA